jgi:NADH:ubiquinone oxidoreductase subunit 4 (subunit M)
MFVIFVPIFLLFAFMKPPTAVQWGASVLALLGLWLLTGGIGQINRGDALTVVAASAVILTAGYLLWTLQRMYLGPPNEKYATLQDINGRELFTLVPLGAIVIFLGIYPAPILNLQSPALLRLNEWVLAASAPTATSVVAAVSDPAAAE